MTSTPCTLKTRSEKPAHLSWVECSSGEDGFGLLGGDRAATDRRTRETSAFCCSLLPPLPPTMDQSNKGTTPGKKVIFKPSPELGLFRKLKQTNKNHNLSLKL